MPQSEDLNAENARLAARVTELESRVAEASTNDLRARGTEARLAHILAVTPSVIYVFDIARGLPVWLGGRAGSILGYEAEDFEDRDGTLRGTLIHPDDQPAAIARLMDLARQPDGHVAEQEFRLRRKDGTFRWVLDRAAVFERDDSGRITKTISAAIDIDERRRADERRTMLINELNHRVKNTLAAVQSIARQTLKSARPAEQTLQLFTARLVALSAAHDVLTRENWQSAALREIAESALRPFALDEDRVTVAGPDVRLGARAALAFAMALHELATNAVKYGALSGETGQVDLTWRACRDGDGPRLELEWRETGGPPVADPSHAGFGSRLITQGLRADLDGTAELTFAPGGVVCRITAPLETATVLELA